MSVEVLTNLELRARIEESIAEELTKAAAAIGVTVDGEIATLTGHVASFREKWATEEAARRAGPSAVVNELKVRLSPEDERSDEDIARSALSTLKWDVRLPCCDRIQVSVDDGVVALDGIVDWAYQVNTASQALAHLAGVRVLTNRLTVESRVSADEVRRQIAAALEHAAVIDASHVKVTVSGTHVVLSGHVRSWLEREDSERAAAAVPGVTAVDNHMKIANW